MISFIDHLGTAVSSVLSRSYPGLGGISAETPRVATGLSLSPRIRTLTTLLMSSSPKQRLDTLTNHLQPAHKMKLLYPTSLYLDTKSLEGFSVELHPYDVTLPIPESLIDAEFLVTWSNKATNLRDAASRMKNLRWIQSLAAGPNDVLAAGFDASRVAITTGSGLHDETVAEHTLGAAGTQDVFASIDALFGHPESTTLLLSKLIYHLVHCLIYRPFLPIDLVELRGTGQHQSWQIEATNLCFSHSNAIAELVELGRNSPLIEWPAFVSYCVCTAGTVHVHGVHYKGHEGEVFSSSAEFLTREMNQLAWLRNIWTGVQHQRELLQTIYTCHSELVRNLASSSMRFSPVFHLEDFLDRYPGLMLDGSHVRLIDAADDLAPRWVAC